MYINSPGGVVTSGWRSRHHAIHPSAGVDALHGSSGVDGLAVLPPAIRTCVSRCRIAHHVHQPPAAFSQQPISCCARNPEPQKRLNEIYVKHTGQTYKAIEDALERDKPYRRNGPGFGIVDKVIDKRWKNPAKTRNTAVRNRWLALTIAVTSRFSCQWHLLPSFWAKFCFRAGLAA